MRHQVPEEQLLLQLQLRLIFSSLRTFSCFGAKVQLTAAAIFSHEESDGGSADSLDEPGLWVGGSLKEVSGLLQ